MNMKKWAKQKGFTIVELLIVIVVIAILAAITIVAYNGIQTRAENSKTASAVAAWAKALQMYKVDEGSYPVINSCLGASDTYADAHSGRCYGLSSDGTWTINTTFLAAMADYIGSSQPVPSNKDINANASNTQYRGAMYYVPGNLASNAEIRASFFGVTTLATCPNISGLNAPYGIVTATNGRGCMYKLPQ